MGQFEPFKKPEYSNGICEKNECTSTQYITFECTLNSMFLALGIDNPEWSDMPWI